MTPWERVVEATDKHNIERVTVVLEDVHSWTYVECSCGQTFDEQWEFTDHIRCIVFDVVADETEPEP